MIRKSFRINVLFALLLASTVSFNACKDEETPLNEAVVKPSLNFVALLAGNQIIRYNSANTDQVASSTVTVTLTGALSGESLVAIDYRPSTKALYGLTSANRIFVITVPTSATATTTTAALVSAVPFAVTTSATVAGFDFDPTNDKLRVVTTSGQSYQVDPTTGVGSAAPAINGVAGALITGLAFANNVKEAPSTTLYGLDVANQKLYRQNISTSVINEIGPLGSVALPSTSTSYSSAYNTNINNSRLGAAGGFDISASGIALAVFNNQAAPAIPMNGIAQGNPSAAVNAVAGTPTLFMVNLETGKLTPLSVLTNSVIGIAIAL